MLKRLFSLACILWLCGCAGPQLRESAVEMGPSFGSLQERQIVQNLGRYLNAPWSIPGQIDITSGTLQIQNQATLGMKFPYLPTGREFDPSLQTQEQDSFVLSPVTDGDDLRRVQALYEFAVCQDVPSFRAHWQETISPYKAALAKAKSEDERKAAKQADLIKDAAASDPQVVAAMDTLKNANAHLSEINKRLANATADAVTIQSKDKDDEKVTAAKSRHEMLLADRAEQQQLIQTIPILQGDVVTLAVATKKSPAATPPSKGESADKGTAASAPADSVELEQAREDQITRVLGGARFLYWTDAGSRTTQRSPCATIPPERASPYSDNFYRIGSAAGYDFYTDRPDKFAQFIMFVLGSTTNTSGVHALTSNLAGNTVPKSQAQTTLFFQRN